MSRGSIALVILLGSFLFVTPTQARDYNGTWEMTVEVPPDGDPDTPRDACMKLPIDDKGDAIYAELPGGGHLEGTEAADGALTLKLVTPPDSNHQESITYHLNGTTDRLEGTMSDGKEAALQVRLHKIANEKNASENFTCDGKFHSAGAHQKLDSSFCETFGVSYLINKISSTFTAGFFVPMNPCSMFRRGAALYLLGDTGPGVRMYGTTTVVVPVYGNLLKTCQATGYPFWITAGERLDPLKYLDAGLAVFIKLIDQVDKKGFLDKAKYIASRIGDFAVTTGYNTNSQNLNLYISVPKDEMCKNENVVWLRNKLKTYIGKIAIPGQVRLNDTFCGKVIRDDWNLRGAPVPLPTCTKPLLFNYLFGTMKVGFKR
jgi:hypothetical protein